MKTVTIELSVDSCERAIKELVNYESTIKPKLDEVCKRLAEVGKQEIISIVSSIPMSEGNSVSNVDALPTDNGWKIVMEGEDVYFIEFGTGNSVSPHFDTSVPVAWGTWSAEHSQMLWKKGFWYYEKHRFTETKAYMPMFYAEKRMRQELPRIMQEVLGK